MTDERKLELFENLCQWISETEEEFRDEICDEFGLCEYLS